MRQDGNHLSLGPYGENVVPDVIARLKANIRADAQMVDLLVARAGWIFPTVRGGVVR